jgi:hypothetical protein
MNGDVTLAPPGQNRKTSSGKPLVAQSVVRVLESAQAIAIAPPDEANVTLVNRVHPPTWRNPQPAHKYDLVVLGGGTAGLVSALGCGRSRCPRGTC